VKKERTERKMGGASAIEDIESAEHIRELHGECVEVASLSSSPHALISVFFHANFLSFVDFPRSYNKRKRREEGRFLSPSLCFQKNQKSAGSANPTLYFCCLSHPTKRQNEKEGRAITKKESKASVPLLLDGNLPNSPPVFATSAEQNTEDIRVSSPPFSFLHVSCPPLCLSISLPPCR